MIRRTFRRFQSAHHPPYGFAPPPYGGPGSSGHPSSLIGSRHTGVHLEAARFVLRPPRNTVVCIVPQGTQMVVERLGRYSRTLSPGLTVLVPFLDRIRYVYSSKEQGIAIPSQSAITKDNVMVDIDGVIFLRIYDAAKASYNIDNPIYNLINLAQTTMRSEIGKLTLDRLFEERDHLNKSIVAVIKSEAEEWGVECKRYEIRDITVSDTVRQAMDLQAEAERRKRKLVLESEGEAKAEANRAQGHFQAVKLRADAAAYDRTVTAKAEAEAQVVLAEAASEAVKKIAEVMQVPGAHEAVSARIAEDCVKQFGNLAKATNAVVLSAPVGDPASLATQVLSVYDATRQRAKFLSTNKSE